MTINQSHLGLDGLFFFFTLLFYSCILKIFTLFSISRIYRLLATCWYLSGVCALSSSQDIARYHSNSPIYTAHIKVNQPAYFMERNMDISRTTQCTNTGQVPACSQEPVDSTDASIVETSTCLETTQQETTNFTVRLLINRTGPCSAALLSVQSSYRYQNIL